MDVCKNEWNGLEQLSGKQRNNQIEKFTIQTTKNPNPKYDFSCRFYKFPSYLRRAAIQEALGCYSSYKSNLINWEAGGRCGKEPKLSLDRNVMPTLYKDNMYVRIDENNAKGISAHFKAGRQAMVSCVSV